MKSQVRILIAADDSAAAEAAAAPLTGEFDDIVQATQAGRGVADFDLHQAPVCVLAFERISRAEQYLSDLERSSETLHAFRHRRIVLCSQAEAPRAYALCLQGRFDDYVVFWGPHRDAQRLMMAVQQACRELPALAQRAQRQRSWVQQVQLLKDLDSRLEGSASWVVERVDALLASMRELRANPALPAPELERRIDEVDHTLGWLRHWALRLTDELHAELAAVNRLRTLAGRTRPLILAIDDDEFQHLLLRRLLGDEDVDLLFATSVADAMALLQLQRPDCILMDIGLPDLDGIDAVRMIKSVAANASIQIVMMTGAREDSALQRSLDAGAVGYIAKPFNRAILLSRLRTVLPEGTRA